MRCNPSYWLLGLVPIAMLSWAAVQLEHDGIESDLGRRTQQALEKSGLKGVAPIFSGRDAVVTGTATDDSEPTRALSSVREVWGVRVANGRIELIDAVDKYIWSAENRGDGRLILTGFAPNDDTRKSVLKAARAAFAEGEVIDQMKLARGAPDRTAWLSGTAFALTQLAQLKRGSAELNELGLTMIGEAATPPSYKSVKAALKSKLPKGISLALEQITPPRIGLYQWAAKSTVSGVELSGFSPSESAREKLAARAKAAFRNATVVDKTEIADGAPDGFIAAAETALDQLAQLKSGSADVKGRDLAFNGEAADEPIATDVRKKLRSTVPQSFKITEQIRYPRIAAPATAAGYVMSIVNGATSIDVGGFIPSEAARSALVDAVRARFPGRTVNDKMQVVAGAPEGWQQCIVAGLAALQRLTTGKAELTDRRLSVTGTTDDYGVASSVPLDVKAAAGQICEAQADIEFNGKVRDDLSWKAVHESTSQVLLQGDVPDDRTRVRLVETAQQLFPSTSVADQMRVVGAPSDAWLPTAVKALEQLARLERGEAAVVAQQVTVRGLAESDQIAADVRSAVESGFSDGFQGTHAITVMSAVEKEADECQGLMRDATNRGILQFERAKADLTPDSTDTLKELAQVANACPRFRIEIEGHTDAEGTDERNQRLSDRRARTVADYLISSGVDANRLSTVGYGATRPIAENETPDGRAKNRRIEFVVKVN